MPMEEERTLVNSTLQLFVSVKEVNISTLISTNFEFQCVFCERLWLWGYPTLLALGLIGNALCLVAFVEHKLRIETRFLCTFLAAIESLSLLITFATRWPDSAFGVSPANLHLLLCYTITIANYWLPELASWTLVVISIERVLSVYLPLGSRRLVRSRYSFIICLCVALMLLAVNVHFLFSTTTKHSIHPPKMPFNEDLHNGNEQNDTIKISSNSEFIQLANRASTITKNQINISKSKSLSFIQTTNTPNPSTEIATKHSLSSSEMSECEVALAGSQWAAWNLVDLCLSSTVPFILLLILNALIILHVFRQKRQPSSPGSVSERSSRNATNAIAATTPFSSGSRSNARYSVTFNMRNPNANRIRNSKAERSVTLMLLFTTLAFLLLRTPISFGHFVQWLLSEERLFKFIEPIICMAAFAVAEILAFGQQAIQFYIYFACSASFRQALRREVRLIIHHLARLIPRHLLHSPTPPSIPPQPSNFQPSAPDTAQDVLYRVHREAISISNSCRHLFQWEDRHILACRLCLLRRLVHHPSCVHYRAETSSTCECLSLDRPVHIVVPLKDYFPPTFGIAYRY